MAIGKIDTSSASYVVLDVETNGLKSKEHDLLSISILKPDDGKEYDRFLPLDLNRAVLTTEINGITGGDLQGKKHLTQGEVDELFDEFELDRRTILHYGPIDPRFIRDYFERHGLSGFERMKFFNFKRLICSTRYADGSLTKDNLCSFFGIEGVSDVHNGMRDCRLEWELFKRLDGRYLLARIVQNGRYFGMWRLSVLNPGYVLPVSYLSTYPNLSRAVKRPYIRCDSEEIYRLTVSGRAVKRFQTNFPGMVVEHLLDTMLGAKKVDNSAFLIENSARNELLGYMPSYVSLIPMRFNEDGSVSAIHDEDKRSESDLNEMINQMRGQLTPLVEFIRDGLFKGRRVASQELVIDTSLGILALCDLSTDDAVLEIKTSACDPQRYAEQLYYEARGRETYLLGMSWGNGEATFIIKRVRVYPGEKPDKRKDKALTSLTAALGKEEIEVVSYTKSKEPIGVRCNVCGYEWEETYPRIKGGKCVCPVCHPERMTRPYRKRSDGAPPPEREKMTPEQALAKRALRFAEKVSARSGGQLVIDLESYVGGKSPVKVCCSKCGYVWEARADHLLGRCCCPCCRQ
ncbi:3'-5' exonuclease [Thermophilibacter sp.]